MSQHMRDLIERTSRAAVKPVLDRLSVHLDDPQDVLEDVVREAVRAVLADHLRGLYVRRPRRKGVSC